VRGYSMAELLVVIAIIAVTVGVSIPTLWTYYRSSQLRGAAEQTATLLNGARQLAIRLNKTICVTIDTTGMQYHQDTCGAAAYTGTGTDSSGYMTLDSGMSFAASSTSNLCFSYLGAGIATPGPCVSSGTVTINRAQGGSMSVVMATTGRVRIQ
jgi:prepilin-type N-terminal cleavage/methylation domain-containing protein